MNKKFQRSLPSLICIISIFSMNSIFAQSTESTKEKFSASWESFQNNYKCPEWFRDAKFGIWAHWSAQCVPEQGDWYAREMYIQGSRIYNHHVKTYGHPSKFGFMEFDNLWKADKWNPEALMKLYKRAGAKYFMALANHHDNFDAYDSKYHKWNSVNVGPKKDIIGMWEKVARKNGLRFGVSNHSAHAWHWFQTAYGYDGEGSLKGIRYDAATLTKEDGRGKWWEGLDTQELYTGPNMKIPDGISGIKEVTEWHEKNDRQWTEEAPKQNPKFTENWLLRCKDLLDKYHPDLVYFDDYGLPLGQAGLDVTAHYYNTSIKRNNGKVDVVVTAKELKPEQRTGIVEDIERGFSENIKPEPWQTCSCIGEWHYRRSLFENNSYKTVKQIVASLVDIVSKNGNLLLSIPMRGDGTIDEREIEFLEGMAKWMGVNGEGIFNTRPWKIYGEGPTQVKAGMFNENAMKNFSSEDIRFTSKGNTLYAFIMDYPNSKEVTIKSLAKESELLAGMKIASVKLLGAKKSVKWNQNESGLKITLPENSPVECAAALKIKLK